MRSLVLVLSLLFWRTAAIARVQPEDVSIIQLIARPQDYDGKFVRLIGFVNLEFEGHAIYLHEEDCRQSLMRNRLWLEATDEVLRHRSTYHRKYVLVEGVFKANNHGHLGGFGGAIESISRWHVWRNPRDERIIPYAVAAFLLGACTVYIFGRNKRSHVQDSPTIIPSPVPPAGTAGGEKREA